MDTKIFFSVCRLKIKRELENITQFRVKRIATTQNSLWDVTKCFNLNTIATEIGHLKTGSEMGGNNTHLEGMN